MKKYTLGLYEKSMPNDLTWVDKLIIGKESGFDSLEISIDESDYRLSRLDWTKQQRKDLLEISRDIDFYINTMCLSGHRKYPLGSSILNVERKGMNIMESAINFSYDLGIHIIQIPGYDIFYNEESTPATKERFMQNLSKSTEMAASLGIILALETMENSFLNTIEKAMYYVETINSPYLKIYPDMGNITNSTDNIAFDIRKGKGQIVAAHLKETVENVSRDMKFGEGRVDFKLVTDVLKAQGVTMFTAEFWYDGKKDWKETLKESNKFLRPYLK